MKKPQRISINQGLPLINKNNNNNNNNKPENIGK